MNISPFTRGADDPGIPEPAAALARGVSRLLDDLGYRALVEFNLTSRRRVDVAALDKGGRFAVVEIKSSVDDFRADRKWREYLSHCDAFYFGVAADFPLDRLPDDCGIIVGDAYYGAIVQRAPASSMNGTRRRAQILRFALTSAHRLQGLLDPRPGSPTAPVRGAAASVRRPTGIR